FFTRVEPEVVLTACRAGEWNPDHPALSRVVEWLGAPELVHDGATQVCALSLYLIWERGAEAGRKERVARALLRAVLDRHGGRQAVTFAKAVIVELAGARRPGVREGMPFGVVWRRDGGGRACVRGGRRTGDAA